MVQSIQQFLPPQTTRSYYLTTDYVYDALDRVTSLQQHGESGGNAVDAKRVDIEYNALGQVTARIAYNTLAADEGDLVWVGVYYYDGANRLDAADQYAAGVTPLSESLYMDITGRITRQWFDGHVSDFSYDNDGQLTGVADVSGQTPLVPADTFAYTANGNRDQTGFTTAGDNELTQAPAPTSGYHYEYAFDAEGNRTDRYLKNASGSTFEHVHYVWDYRDRLREVDTYNASSVLTSKARYMYDANDRRVGKFVNTDGTGGDEITEGYVYDGDNLVLVVDPDGLDTIRRYLMGDRPNEVFAEESVGTGTGGSNQTRWAITDHEGTVRDVLDNSGAVIDHIVYSAFGAIVSQTHSGDAIGMLYTGDVYDAETGLNYAHHRYYDAGTHMWISVDPMGDRAGDVNLYRYVNSDPVGATDPSGLAMILDQRGEADETATTSVGTSAGGVTGPTASDESDSTSLSSPLPEPPASDRPAGAAAATPRPQPVLHVELFIVPKSACSAEAGAGSAVPVSRDDAMKEAEQEVERDLQEAAKQLVLEAGAQAALAPPPQGGPPTTPPAPAAPARSRGWNWNFAIGNAIIPFGLGGSLPADMVEDVGGTALHLPEGYGTTLVSGEQNDSVYGTLSGVVDVMSAGLGGHNFGPGFGFQKAFDHGVILGKIWGTINMAILSKGGSGAAAGASTLRAGEAGLTIARIYAVEDSAARAGSAVLAIRGVFTMASDGSGTPKPRDKIREVYPGIKHAPGYPEGFTPAKNGLSKQNVDDKELLAMLRDVEPGKWQKVYKDGYDALGNKISLHYFESPSGQVFNFKVKEGWSTL